MRGLIAIHDRMFARLSSRLPEAVMLLFLRLSRAEIFGRSGRSKVVDGSWLEISDSTRFLFAKEYKGAPFPPDLAAPLATWSKHLFSVFRGCISASGMQRRCARRRRWAHTWVAFAALVRSRNIFTIATLPLFQCDTLQSRTGT